MYLNLMQAKNNLNFLIDSHCHLNMLRNEKGLNIDDVINRSNQNYVNIINNIGTHISEFDSILELSNQYDDVYASLGVHPSEALNQIATLDILLDYAKQEKVIGIGESGLEYHYEPINKNIQKKNFEIHIEACRQTKLPLIIHSRDADEDMMDILKTEMKNGEFSFVLHCFSSGKDLCYTGLDLGGYISLSGIITFKKSGELRDIIKNVPLNRLLLETDAPFLPPEPYRGKINEPAFIKNIVNYLVKFLKKDFNIITNETSNNFLQLFNKVKRSKYEKL